MYVNVFGLTNTRVGDWEIEEDRCGTESGLSLAFLQFTSGSTGNNNACL